MSEDSGDKTEEPTQQRREDFRKRGQVAQSKELASVLVLMGAMICIWAFGRYFLIELQEVFTLSFSDFVVVSARNGDWLHAFLYSGKKVFILIAPILGMMGILTFASSVMQVGFLFNEEALQFKPERLDPMQGLKKIFSMKSLVEGIKAVFKVSIVCTIVYFMFNKEVSKVPQLVSYDVEQLFVFLGELSFKLLGAVCFFMAVLAGIDLLFQRWDLEQKMKMSKQEVKEEMKNREGDPMIRARIRRVQREMANKRMMEDVPKADVVITNPTHIAVALKYSDQMVAPTIVAMGADLIAEKIKAVAKENNVPVMENKPLARTIYKTLKIGQAIPRELYTAVAEVLSYVYKLRKKKGIS